MLWLLSACTSANLEEELREAFLRDPASGVLMAESIPDPVVRTATVMAVVESHPHRSRPLCRALPERHSRERCERINQRPHLWKQQPNQQSSKSYPPPSTEECTLSSHDTTCRSAKAIKLAVKSTEKALSECAAIEEDQWRSECSFLVAEQLMQNPASIDSRFKDVARACGLSAFQKSCWHHSLISLCSDTTDWQWDWIADLEHHLVQHTGPNLSPDLATHLWGLCIATRQLPLPQNPPQIAQSNIRNRAAVELLRWADLPTSEPAQWVSQLINGQTVPKRTKPRGYLPDHDSWMGAKNAPSTAIESFLGRSHRFTFSDPETDAASALLEASLRIRPKLSSFVEWAREHPNETVRWRAQQLSDKDWTLTPDQRAP